VADTDHINNSTNSQENQYVMPDYILELNAKHALVMVGGQCLIMTEMLEPINGQPSIILSRVHELKTFYANRPGPQGRNIVDSWLQHPQRRQYQGIVCNPEQDVEGYYNLWRGFAVEPIEGDCLLYLQHIQDTIASGNEQLSSYILAWMADAVQHPGQRPGVSLVLRGKQGVGKGVFVTQFGKLFGRHFKHLTRPRHLLGNFNAHLQDALIVFADEAFWVDTRQAAGALKTMVTEETLQIEPKGKDIYTVQNHIRLMIASNAEWVVPAGLEERRFCVVDVSEAHMQDTAYFQALVAQMDNGGREALLHHLLHLDIAGVNLRNFPKTSALYEMKLHSMTAIQRFWFDKLWVGALQGNASVLPNWRGHIACTVLLDEYLESLGKTAARSRSIETLFGVELKKLMPPGFDRQRRPCPNGSRVWHYLMPPLDVCRQHFAHLMQMVEPWPSEEE